MVHTHYKLNTGASIPAIGQYGPASILACRGLTQVCFLAFGGWGGFTEQERLDFAPTFGDIIKVVIFWCFLGPVSDHCGFTGGIQAHRYGLVLP